MSIDSEVLKSSRKNSSIIKTDICSYLKSDGRIIVPELIYHNLKLGDAGQSLDGNLNCCKIPNLVRDRNDNNQPRASCGSKAESKKLFLYVIQINV